MRLLLLTLVCLLFSAAAAAASLPSQVDLPYPKAPVVKLVKGCHWSNGSTTKTIHATQPYTVNVVNLAPKPHRLRRTSGIHVAMPDWPLARYEAVGFRFRSSGTVTMKSCAGKAVLTIVLG